MVYPEHDHESESALRQGKEVLAEGRRLRAESELLLARAKQAGEHLLWTIQEIKRQRQKDFYRQMQAGIWRLYDCSSRHVASFAVRKVSAGQTVWDGTVEEFELTDCRTAKTCHAWYYQERNRQRSFSVLKIPPVYSPQNAVQLALAARNLPPIIEFEVR